MFVIDDQVAAAREVIDRGVCEVVVLSLGAEGALLVTRDRDEYFPSVEVPVVSGVGAGDSMVAGVVGGLACGRSLSDSVRRRGGGGDAAGTRHRPVLASRRRAVLRPAHRRIRCRHHRRIVTRVPHDHRQSQCRCHRDRDGAR